MSAQPAFSPLSTEELRRHAEPLIRETIQRVLTRRHVDQSDISFSKALRSKHSAACLRMKSSHVIGVGFGAKVSAGSTTGETAIRVYVTRKIRTSELSRAVRIPKTINGISTDVVAVGRPRHHLRPVALGASISRLGGLPGSIGCIVTKAGAAKSYLLSAAHVLSPDVTARIGDSIVEPATPNAGAAPIATLTDFELLKPDGGKNFMDAAIALLLKKSDVLDQLPRIGELATPVMPPTLYQSVRKFGAASAHTLGIVTDATAEITIQSPIDGENYLYSDVFDVTGCGGEFSRGGDSGALIVDAQSNRPVGIVIGGRRDHTFAAPIQRILDRFQATIA